MQFYDFENRETFHVFQWVYDCLNVADLVKEAFEKVEGNEWFASGESVSVVAREELALIIENAVWDLANERLGVDAVPRADDAIEDAYLYGNQADRLALPLLHRALQHVYFGVVAQAVLIRQGKWSPDTETPDISE